ncbi:glycogen debranching N-terminal domain-containing protein [soil metagenome]
MTGLAVMQGSAFFFSDERGDVRPRGAEGLFVADVRHLSLWQLLVEGAPTLLLSSHEVAPGEARVYGTLDAADLRHDPPLSVARVRRIRDGVHERVIIESHSSHDQHLRVELRFASDFKDIFEARAGRLASAAAGEGTTWTERDGLEVRLCHEHEGFKRVTQVAFDAPFELVHDRARFDVRLAPRTRWELCIRVSCSGDGIERPATETRSRAGGSEEATEDLIARAPALQSGSELLGRAYAQSLADLGALGLAPTDTVAAGVPAGGLPWFMALFGRDSLIAAYGALPFVPELARATLQSLAALQAERDDAWRDAEPGKILHELRRGKLAALGRAPHTPYYGSHDSTPLWLILLDEYERWTGDAKLVRELEEPARKALRWIEDSGDLDGDGYLEYRVRSPLGLTNHCWKDSPGSMAFADGTRAAPPLATCEIQGYAYDARRRMARLCREVWDDAPLAARLDAEGDLLRDRFNVDYWSARRDHYVLGLDGRKTQVDSMTSNVGHLLWSGIVADERAHGVATRLLAPDMFTGWGLRTMSAEAVAYNPIGYHVGTVWPHDTGIGAEGLRRYGFKSEAAGLALSLLEAAACFGHRLPEVFAGFDRAATVVPVEYASASRPQAWAAAAPLLALRTLLGMDVEGGRLRCDPCMPAGLAEVHLTNVMVRGRAHQVP